MLSACPCCAISKRKETEEGETAHVEGGKACNRNSLERGSREQLLVNLRTKSFFQNCNWNWGGSGTIQNNTWLRANGINQTKRSCWGRKPISKKLWCGAAYPAPKFKRVPGDFVVHNSKTKLPILEMTFSKDLAVSYALHSTRVPGLGQIT